MKVTKPPPNGNGRDLAHNEYYDLGCTCSWLLGYGVHPHHPNEWAEHILINDSECPINEHRRRS